MSSRSVFSGLDNSRRDWLLPGVVVGLLRLSDALIVILASLVAYVTRFRDFDDLGTFQVFGCVVAVMLTINIFQVAGLYDFNKLTDVYAQTSRLLGCWLLVMVGLLALGFLAKMPLVATSRLWVAMWFGYWVCRRCSQPACCCVIRYDDGGMKDVSRVMLPLSAPVRTESG